MVAAAPASAATPELRGVVSGSPYGASSGYVAVPVLYSKMSARRTGLRSPVGLMVIKRNQRIKVSGAPSTLPVGLRVGDRFKGNAEVSDLNKRIFYPRITFDEPPAVYFRSKELSLAELTRLIQAVEKNLTALTKYTKDGFSYIVAQLAGLQAQINDLKALLGTNIAGAVDLSGLQSQIDALNKKVDDLLASLANYALKTDLSGLLNTTQVQNLLSTTYGITGPLTTLVTNIVNGLGLPDPQTVVDATLLALGLDDPEALVKSVVASLTTGELPTFLTRDTEVASIVSGLSSTDFPASLARDADLDAATGQIGTLQTDLAAVEADLTKVCTAVKGLTASIPAGALGTIAGVQIPATTYDVPVTLGENITSVCP